MVVIVGQDQRFCRYCYADLSWRADPFDHYKRRHPTCRFCPGHAFRTKERQRDHYHLNHVFCHACRTWLEDKEALRKHTREIHAPTPVACPMDHCEKHFPSISAVILHLESGSCVSGVTRPTVDRYMIERDTSHTLTRRLRQPTLLPRPIKVATAIFVANESSFNGEAYECFFCHCVFRSLSSLNCHLASPKHSKPEKSLYRCPHHNCATLHDTLSGLYQHIESECCGAGSAPDVERSMDDLLRGMNTLRLTYEEAETL